MTALPLLHGILEGAAEHGDIYLAIANNAGDWVANTDDLTNRSDLTTATFVDGTPVSPLQVSVSTPAETTALTLNKG